MRRVVISALLSIMLASKAFAFTPAEQGQGPVTKVPGIPASLLPAYNRLADGWSWAGHLDAESYSNLAGGQARGTTANLLGQLGGRLDTGRAGLWSGGQFTLTGLGILAGADPEGYSAALQSPSNIYAPSRLHLYQLSFRQQLGAGVQLRLGYDDINHYFDVVGNAENLLNSAFGFTPTITENVPGNGSYPYSALGALIGLHGDHWGTKLGIFQGDAQHQFTHTFARGYLALWEGGLRWGSASGASEGEEGDDGAAYVLKLGAWHYRQPHPELPELSPSTSGVYTVWEARRELTQGRRLGLFLQGAAAPQTINRIPWQLALGLRLQQPFPGRSGDSLSLGVTRSWLRSAVLRTDEDLPAGPIHPAETAYELTYVAQLRPYLSVQPDIQFIHRPQGVYPDATAALLRVHLEFF
ncbi:MAG: carbohydrate porin [Acidithiobacillus sp.]